MPAVVLVIAGTVASLTAGYKAKPWPIRPAEAYAARLASEGVTIAVEPLHDDPLAAKVFDKNDIVTRCIMPLGIIVFNENDFPIVVEADSIELIHQDERYRTLSPAETVHRLFPPTTKSLRSPLPIPSGGPDKQRADALEDFDHKFLGAKLVPARGKASGFLFLKFTKTSEVMRLLKESRVYIPEVYREDTGKNLMFFEIDLKPALESAGNAK